MPLHRQPVSPYRDKTVELTFKIPKSPVLLRDLDLIKIGLLLVESLEKYKFTQTMRSASAS